MIVKLILALLVVTPLAQDDEKTLKERLDEQKQARERRRNQRRSNNFRVHALKPPENFQLVQAHAHVAGKRGKIQARLCKCLIIKKLSVSQQSVGRASVKNPDRFTCKRCSIWTGHGAVLGPFS